MKLDEEEALVCPKISEGKQDEACSEAGDSKQRTVVYRVKKRLYAETYDCVVASIILMFTLGGTVLSFFYCKQCLMGILCVSACLCPWIPYFNIPLWTAIIMLIYLGILSPNDTMQNAFALKLLGAKNVLCQIENGAILQLAMNNECYAAVVQRLQHCSPYDPLKVCVNLGAYNADTYSFEDCDLQIMQDSTMRSISEVIKAQSLHVMRTLGAGHRERIYHRALITAFNHLKIPHRSEVVCPIWFMGQCIGMGRADLVIGDIVIEIKAIRNCPRNTSDQLRKYIVSFNKHEKRVYRGMVVNFNQKSGNVDVLEEHCVTEADKKESVIFLNSLDAVRKIEEPNMVKKRRMK